MPLRPNSHNNFKKLKIAPVIEDLQEFKASVLPQRDLNFSTPLEYYQSTIDRIPFFAIGKFMWSIAQRFSVLKIGGMVDEFLDKDAQACTNIDKYFELMHPDDFPYAMTYLKLVHDFLLPIPLHEKRNFHPNIYFRFQKPGCGKYSIILLQFIDWLCNQDGDVESILHLWSDISHIGPADFKPMLTILDTKNEILYFSKADMDEQNKLCAAQVVHFSHREKEILHLLAKGFGSKQIAAQLNIAKNTVENHRQHILKKTSCKSSAEVVAYAAKYGFL